MGNDIVQELIKGRDWTKQLQTLIRKPYCDHLEVLKQKELVDNIFGSLAEVISVMSTGGGGSCDNSGEVFQIPVSPGDGLSVDSGRSCKRLGVKDRRGGYKRRKSSNSWTKISSSMMDEYAWRKYGQKEILNATFPRCYFRCTHKHDQGCKATKQVQRIQEEPINYHITYFGQHTCRKTLQPNFENIIVDSNSEESNLINFQSNTPSEQQYPSPSFPISIKEESKEVEVQSGLSLEEFPPLDSISLPDLTPLMRANSDEDFLPGVYSYASSIDSRGMDMEFFSKYDDFGNYFESNF